MTALETHINHAEALISALIKARRLLQQVDANDIRANDDTAFARCLIADLLNHGWTPPQ